MSKHPSHPSLFNKNECRTTETNINPVIGEAVTVCIDSAAEQDGRVMCSDCANLNWYGRCTQWEITNPGNSKYNPVQDVKDGAMNLCANKGGAHYEM